MSVPKTVRIYRYIHRYISRLYIQGLQVVCNVFTSSSVQINDILLGPPAIASPEAIEDVRKRRLVYLFRIQSSLNVNLVSQQIRNINERRSLTLPPQGLHPYCINTKLQNHNPLQILQVRNRPANSPACCFVSEAPLHCLSR